MPADCAECLAVRAELCMLRHQLGVQVEELTILRKAQTECAEMAAEIEQLHLCVEEQRRHLQLQSKDPKDPGVGIFTWMQTVQRAHQDKVVAVRAECEEVVMNRTAVLAHQVALQEQQLATLHHEYTVAAEHAKRATDDLADKERELALAYNCINEQRRHIASLASGACGPDVDVGLLPMVRAGVVSVETAVKPSVSDVGTDADDMLPPPVQDVELVERMKAMLLLEYDAWDARLMNLTRENERLAQEADAASMFQQLYTEVMRDTTDQSVRLAEAEASAEAATTRVSDLEKENKALFGGLRHWKEEAQRVTAELTVVLGSRDRAHEERYQTLQQMFAIKERVTSLEEEMLREQKMNALGKQVLELASGVLRAQQEEELASSPPAPAASTAGGVADKKKKSGKK